MSKIDFKKELKHLYRASAAKPTVVEVPTMNYLMVDGIGHPDTSKRFIPAIEALYPLAYTLKFMSKLGPKALDYVVPPLEGLWWADDMDAFLERRLDEWKWTLMIMQPDFISVEMFEEAKENVRKKKSPSLLDEARFEKYEEGLSAQLLHVGPFEEEAKTVDELHGFIEEQGKELALKHHEIYLSDLRKTAPEKLKTILRQPMR